MVSKLKFLQGRKFASAFAVATLLSAGYAVADTCPEINPEALKWLDKMSRSAHEVNYQGVVTFQRGDDMQVMQISHTVSGQSATESLTQLTGQGAQVVRVEHPLDCIHPGHRLLRLGTDLHTAAGDGSSAGTCGLSEHYRFSVTEGERVAGRKAVRIVVAPRDMYRYGYVMELDKQTGLLLKTATIGRGDKVLENFQFANLSYGEGGSQTADVDLVHEAEHPVVGRELVHERSYSVDWGVGWLPNGFMATDSSSGGERRRTYTDGLAVFSVFLEILPRDIQPGEGVVRRGGTTSYTRGVRMAGRPALITVIGEVPVNTARMVADSVALLQ
ncbi:MAG: MucB/RseB C-terminal domain-containing protein [Proteobacteria bacterium]|nr:MucB/RseB C-terminal domain-containing protein [Pseudomonadota bacterium]